MRRLVGVLAAYALAGAVAGCGEEDTIEEQRAMDRALLVGPSPVGVAAGEGGVFVVDDKERSLRRFDASPLRRSGEPVRLPGTPVAVAAGAGAAWVLVRGPSALLRVDPRSGRVATRVALRGDPVAVDAGGSGVWVATRRPNAVVCLDRCRGATVGRALTLAVEPSAVSSRDVALWVASERSRRLLRLDGRSGEVARSFRPPSGLSGMDAGDSGTVWFAQGDEQGPYGHVPVEADYVDLEQGAEQDGYREVAVGPRGRVFVLSAVDRDSDSAGGGTTSFRTVLRVDPETGESLGSSRVSDDARALAAGEGAAWVVEPATGHVASGTWRLAKADG